MNTGTGFNQDRLSHSSGRSESCETDSPRSSDWRSIGKAVRRRSDIALNKILCYSSWLICWSNLIGLLGVYCWALSSLITTAKVDGTSSKWDLPVARGAIHGRVRTVVFTGSGWRRSFASQPTAMIVRNFAVPLRRRKGVFPGRSDFSDRREKSLFCPGGVYRGSRPRGYDNPTLNKRL